MSIIVQVLKNTELFSPFTEEELNQLIPYCAEMRLPKGTIIFREGLKDDNSVYFVQEGVIKIIKGEGDKQMVLAMFGLGNIFGEMSFLDSQVRSATAMTDDDSVVFKLVPDKFYEYGNQVPRAAMKMFKVFISKLVRRLRETDEALVTKSHKIIIT